MKKISGIIVLLFMLSLIIITGCAGTTGNAGLKIGLCGAHEEKYTTNEKGCENMDKCKCIHNSFFGGNCDNCECTREVNDC